MPEPVNPGTKISLSELSDARQKLSGFRRTHRASDRQAAGKLLESMLTKAGVDLEPLKALQSQRAAAAREQIARIKAEADEQSSAALSAVEHTIQAWRKNIGNLSTLQLPLNVQRFLLDTASEIATTPGLEPVAKHIGPQNNSAQFHFESTDSGFEQVDFGFLWQNPNDQPALVNVDGYLILNGLCQILVSGDFFGIFSSVEIRTFLRIHELWNSPPTSPAPQSSQFQRALEMDLENPGPFSGGEISSENLFRGFDLQYSSFMVPPLALAGFEMLCEIFYKNDDGEVNLFFSDRGREVLCPGVLLTVMS
jgi:hypothetical protein